MTWAGLKTSLGPGPLSPDQQTRQEIIESFWGKNPVQTSNGLDINLTQYWKYYNRECTHALLDGGRHIALRKHQDAVDIAAQIHAGLTRDEIKDNLRTKLTTSHDNEDELLEYSIYLVSGLISMIDCGTSSYAFSGRTEMLWRQDTLQLQLSNYFGDPPVLGHDSTKLENNFTARNLGRIAGLEIVWTDNLADHLRMSDDDTKVHIFHHASFLEHQRRSPTSLLPVGVAAETLQTLSLLLPSADVETQKWFLKVAATTDLDARTIRCGKLRSDRRQIERFRFWRDRLVTLKQVFDEAQPKTLSQWWHDRRNGVQWYTFWVAILVLVLTIVFGLIQSVEGALQVYTSFKSMSGS